MIASAYDIEIATFTLLPLGADLDACVYKAQALDKTSYFVKLKRGHHHNISLTLLALLQASGIQHIIPPVKTISGNPSQDIDGFTLIVYPFIEGQNGFSCHLTNDQWIALGSNQSLSYQFSGRQNFSNTICVDLA